MMCHHVLSIRVQCYKLPLDENSGFITEVLISLEVGTHLMGNDPNHTSVKIKLTPPVDSLAPN